MVDVDGSKYGMLFDSSCQPFCIQMIKEAL